MSCEIVIEGLCGTPCIQWKIEGDHACHGCDVMDDFNGNDEDDLFWDDPYG
jgi:hypothetical protein